MKNIIEYQKLDMALYKLDRESNLANEKAIMNKMIAYMMDLQNKSNVLDKSASEMIERYSELKKNYTVNFNEIMALSKLDLDKLSLSQANENLYKANQISSNLFKMERELNELILKMKETLKDFDATKINAVKARGRHKDSKELYDRKLAELEPKKKEIIEKMKALEPSIEKDLLIKYNQLKHDGIFPVFVPLNEGRCGGCRMEVPANKINSMKEKEFIICEQCRRIIVSPTNK